MSHKTNESRKRKLAPSSPITYIMVVGFHHKKGCQLEFAYPDNLQIKKNTDTNNNPESDLYTLPKKWRHLPSLALPDGSHNYESDYIYFHLEDDDSEDDENDAEAESKTKKAKTKLKPSRTIFGISCFRQINASELINKDSEVTRNTLQKSVCILSTRPLYANIRLKLHSITCAYFEQKDFHKTQLLINAFNTLSVSYETPTKGANLVEQNSNYLIGLSLGDLVVRYQHKILALFKLLLLQKKCLFQIKPVSNLSNTIISLVSLMPEIFMTAKCGEEDGNKDGLGYCAGFFDSADLVSCELERKSKQKDDVVISAERRSLNEKKLNGSISSKKLKKKMKSFSNKKKSTSNSPAKNDSPIKQTPTTNQQSNNSLNASISSMSLKNQTDEAKIVKQQSPVKKETVTNKSSFLNVFSANTQKFFGLNSDDNNDRKVNSNQPLNDNEIELEFDNYHKSNNSFNQSKLDLKPDFYLTGHSSSFNDDPNENNNKTGHGSSETESALPKNSHFGDVLKSKMSNVFKLVDWSSNSAPSTNHTSSPNHSDSTAEPKPLSRKHRSSNHHKSRTSIKQQKPEKQQQTPTFETRNEDLEYEERQIQLSELLQIDFSMPFNLFSEFNVLHPYLSLYYLDYFTMVNKMSTKLFCTTSLMMTMMTEANRANENSNDEEKNDTSTESGNFSLDQTNTGHASNNSPRSSNNQTSFGYTIGATNILFKQRLYDELDAFIDESEIDLRQNDQLKKQLQLTTADLRFADYIIKHVNASRNLKQNTPVLLSVKKTSSFNTFEPNSGNGSGDLNIDSSTLSSSWEGSDDWIRLNFKCYLYSLLASMVKEDLCTELKYEIESIVNMLNFESNYSSSSSTLSLENEVVDIDDYIEKSSRVLSQEKDSPRNSDQSLNDSQTKKKKSRKNSWTSSFESSITSMQAYVLNSNSHLSYRDDFNSSFVSAFRQTDSFKNWYETAGRAKLEKSLFNKKDQISQEVAPDTNLNSRIQVLLRQLKEVDQVRVIHPFNGQISVSDLKLRFNFLFTTTESGRKINKALAEGGKIVNTTGKAVGEALSHAKSSFSSFLNSWSSPLSRHRSNGVGAAGNDVKTENTKI